MPVETRPCGCRLDHDRRLFDPCKAHYAEIFAAVMRDNGGKVKFASKEELK